MKPTPEELTEILAAHQRWVTTSEDPTGRRANLTGANLTGADLRGTNFTGASLRGINLRGTNLRGTNLTRADLTRADLTGANLTRANLMRANLTGADLTGADLTGTDLTGVYPLTYAQVSFSSHGECGRMLTGVQQKGGGPTHFYCGCFFGTEQDLRSYIAEGPDNLKSSRTLALETVIHLIATPRTLNPEP